MMAGKPVVLPEPFDGEASWEDWKLHFEDVAAVNEWTDDQKLKWLRVRLTGRAQKAFHRLPDEVTATYRGATTALQERFEPKSKKTRYQAEFEARRKKRAEGWADFAEDLGSLTDKAYPELQPEARELLALQAYLRNLDHPQISFSAKQRRPKTVDEAVAATPEMESYASTLSRGPESIASVQDPEDDSSKEGGGVIPPVAAGDPTEKLGALLEKLMERVEDLEQRQPRSYQRRSGSSGMPTQVPRWNRRRRQFAGLCLNCQQPGHLARNCPQKVAPEN